MGITKRGNTYLRTLRSHGARRKVTQPDFASQPAAGPGWHHGRFIILTRTGASLPFHGDRVTGMKTLHATNRPAYYRTVWISDVHLGFSGCKAEFLLDFLHSTRCDQLYLVGDIIDVWCMKKRLYWPQEHNNVVRTLLGKAKHGTRVVYIPGNHDEVFRDHGSVLRQPLDPEPRDPHHGRRPAFPGDARR